MAGTCWVALSAGPSLPLVAGNDDQREVRRGHRLHPFQRHDPLVGHGRPLDVQRAALEAKLDQHAADLVEIAAELHPHRRVGIRRITEATVDQLEKRLVAAERWLKKG